MPRLRAALLVAGAALFGASLLLHPVLLDPHQEGAAYRTILAYGPWRAIHWVALAGILLWTVAIAGAGTPEPARLLWTAGLTLWAVVLPFEAVAMPLLAARDVPGFWAWGLATGYAAAAAEGLALAVSAAAARPGPPGYRWLAGLTGGVTFVVAPLAYSVPAVALPALALAGAGWTAFTAWTAGRWWRAAAEDAGP